MTINLALEYIPRRMQELGIDERYYLRFRHFVLQGEEVKQINASGQFFILVEEVAQISVESDMGIFDLAFSDTDELIYEHQGKIILRNQSLEVNRVHFIQVIPKHKK